MDFNSVDNLSKEEILSFFEDIGNDTQISACCCYAVGGTWTSGVWSFEACNTWCRSQSQIICGFGGATRGSAFCDLGTCLW